MENNAGLPLILLNTKLRGKMKILIFRILSDRQQLYPGVDPLFARETRRSDFRKIRELYISMMRILACKILDSQIK